MTCEGCDRQVTLMDGHYCGHCGNAIAAAVAEALEDVDVVDGEVNDVYVATDEKLHVTINREQEAETDVE